MRIVKRDGIIIKALSGLATHDPNRIFLLRFKQNLHQSVGPRTPFGKAGDVMIEDIFWTKNLDADL
jgi:hypothetical protein